MISRFGPWPAIALVAVAAALSVFLSAYRLGLLALVVAYTVASLAQNLLSGYADVPSLGNVAFFAASGYSAAGMITFGHVPAAIALPLAVLAAGALGFIVGLPALRISGMHLAIVTVALVLVAHELLVQWDLAHGESGVTVSGPDWLLQERGLYLAALLVAAVAYLLTWNLLRSRSGRAILALSDNPYAALAVGINPTLYRLIAFVLSGILSGAAGIIYLYYSHTVTPDAFPLDLSLAFLTMMMLGGTRSLGGSLVGALIIGLLPQALTFLSQHAGQIDVQQWSYIIYAAMVLLVLRFMPEGIWHAVARRVSRDET